MKTARYKRGFIKASEYNSKLHFDNIFCPDCGKAKLKIVRKADQEPYFAFVADQKHDELCPRVAKPIQDEKIKELVLSDSKKDMSKLNFLVNKNLEKCINLVTKLENDGKLNKEEELNLMPQKKQQLTENRIREYSRQDILTINILDLDSIDTNVLNNKHCLIYGIAGITLSDIGESKKLFFKADQGSRFSIFVVPSQIKYLDFDKGKRAKFAVFGKFKKSGKFLNLEIRSTRDLVIGD
ncbi:hypothetical protein [Francisella marina]|uniref:Uncharacterized protein n=1 Tax=Francisella marina TaxID=2249302 RepID=A0ABX5ZGP6_9GAMM|nr:hypothetical protein [Francisella marina]QEO57385.1 hypothetical protein F0R74_05790 [Francisella marina]QEO58499.1 hypothetical protein F0R75_01435 [Francisella marina]